MYTLAVRLPRLLLVLALALGALPARAQEDEGGLGLDLSGSDTPQTESTESQETPEGGEQPGIGLDLSGEVTQVDLLPRVVLLGLDTPERAGAAMASRWLKALYTSVRSNSQWVLSSPLKEVREQLTDGYDAALRCTEASCLADPANTLDADLLVTARLALEDDGWTLRLWTYDRDRNKVETDVLTGRNPRDAKFMKEGAALLTQRVQGLARTRAILKVNVNVPQAVVRLGERTLGVGTLEAKVAPVEASLIVEADEFVPFAKTITPQPGETTTVEVYLETAGPAPDSPLDPVAESRKQREGPSGPTLFSRPAVYTAVVGLLAVGAGVLVGQQAKKVGTRAVDADGNGIADITRRERLDAASQANLSTALVAGGAAVAGGSLVWLMLVPQTESSKAAPSVAPATTGGSTTSLHLFLGGSF
jgi:hypothetical protein